ncbi:MAG: response regulator transcription factor [Psychromonas sp.]|nr:response regulator transcription factor [Alteromonadales bacterium]MCP5077240.1 response regulator transcription factor [Psychromonas sp.]
MKLSVLLVEDDLDLAATVVDYLDLEEINCDHAANGIAGLSLIKASEFDVILLDINMPQMDGLSVCEALRNEGISTPVLMLTARDTLEDKLAGFEVGSDDYMVKPFDMLELVARIKALSKRRNGLSNKLSMFGLNADFDTKTVNREQTELQISPTGWKILELLMRHSPQVVSREKLMQSVWGDDQPDSNSLKVHLFKLRQQVDANTFSHKLIHTIAGQGFVLQDKQ